MVERSREGPNVCTVERQHTSGECTVGSNLRRSCKRLLAAPSNASPGVPQHQEEYLQRHYRS